MDITVFKARRLLICTSEGTELLRAPIQLGFGAADGPKMREGDGRTPEGAYFISSRNPASRFFRSLGISYPGPHDARRALAEGLIDAALCRRICACPQRPPWDTPLGGFIMIHGQRTPPAGGDWTAGCIALENSAMERLYGLASIGDRVFINP